MNPIAHYFKKYEDSPSSAEAHKILIDAGETLLLRITGLLLAEYHAAELCDMKLEKELYERVQDTLNGKSVSIGHLCSLSQKAAQSLKTNGQTSLIDIAFAFTKPEKKALEESQAFTQMRNCLQAVKNYAETGSEDDIVDFINKFEIKQPPAQKNLIDYNLVFPQIRNRNAHPHFDVRDKKTGEIIRKAEWPLGKTYYELINPIILNALQETLSISAKAWEMQYAVVSDANDDTYTITINEQSVQYPQPSKPYRKGCLLLLDQSKDERICVTLDYHLYVSEQAIKEIEEEQQKAREAALRLENKSQLEANIKNCLEDDGIIDFEEYNLLKAVASNNLHIEEVELKNLIVSVAATLGIENPFPDVDPAFIKLIDEALSKTSINRFKLKLQGEQYGVSPNKFDEIIQDRCKILDVDFNSIIGSEEYSLTAADLKTMRALSELYTWLCSLSILNSDSGETSLFGTKSGANEIKGTKEYQHFTLWNEVLELFKQRIDAQNKDHSQEWNVITNKWNAGKMTGYYWLLANPSSQNKKDKASLSKAYGLNIYASGARGAPCLKVQVTVNRTEVPKIPNFQLFSKIFSKNIINVLYDYKDEFKSYPHFDVIIDGKRFLLNELPEDYRQDLALKFEYDHPDLHLGISFGNFHETWKKNPYKILEIFDIGFALLAPIIKETNLEYALRERGYKNPLLGNKRVMNNALNKLSDVIKDITKKEPEKVRLEQSINYVDKFLFKKNNGYRQRLKYGFWANEDDSSSSIRIGVHFECWIEDNDSNMDKSSPEALDLVNQFNEKKDAIISTSSDYQWTCFTNGMSLLEDIDLTNEPELEDKTKRIELLISLLLK